MFLRPDQEIRNDVVEQVFRRVLWVEPSDVTVEVREGVVTLDGQLENKSLIPTAVLLTRAVDGVVDRLTYRYDDTAVRDVYRFTATP